MNKLGYSLLKSVRKLFPVTARVVGADPYKYVISIACLVTMHAHSGQKLYSSHFKDKIWKEKLSSS